MQKQKVYVVIEDEQIISIHESKSSAYHAAIDRIDESDLYREVVDFIERGFPQTPIEVIIGKVFDYSSITIEESTLIRE